MLFCTPAWSIQWKVSLIRYWLYNWQLLNQLLIGSHQLNWFFWVQKKSFEKLWPTFRVTVSVQRVVSRENEAMPLVSVVSVKFCESMANRYTASLETGLVSGPTTLTCKQIRQFRVTASVGKCHWKLFCYICKKSLHILTESNKCFYFLQMIWRSVTLH